MHNLDQRPKQRSRQRSMRRHLLGFVLLVALAGCGSAADQEVDTANRGIVELTEEDSGKVVNLAADDTIIIRLGANPGTGFEWEVTTTDEKVVVVADQVFEERTDDEGSPGQAVISLVAAEPGNATVSLEYRRPWETDVEPEETVTIEVVVAP